MLREWTGANLIALPSSICPGWGVYALCDIAEGEILAKYHGSKIKKNHYKSFFAALRSLKSDADKIQQLAGYGVEIVDHYPQTMHYRQPRKKHRFRPAAVQWKAVENAISEYSFESKTGYIVPKRINFEGQPLFLLDGDLDYDHLSVFVNEAPITTFRNALTGLKQRPDYPITAELQGDDVLYISKRDIKAGEELFIYYGSEYYREYVPSPNTEEFDAEGMDPELINNMISILMEDNRPCLEPSSKQAAAMTKQLCAIWKHHNGASAQKRRRQTL